MSRNRIVVAAASALAVVAAGTAASAAVLAGPIDSHGVIHACYYPATSGSHRVVLQNAGKKCPRGTTAISWNRVGRTGPQGVPGVPGQPGPQGPAGPAGPGGLLAGQVTLGVGVPLVLSAAQYRFAVPDAVAFEGRHLWVANSGGNTVTEVSPSDGSVVRVLSDPGYQFDDPQGMAFDGSHLWIATGADRVRWHRLVGYQLRRELRHRDRRCPATAQNCQSQCVASAINKNHAR